jgi:hypothetical protein
MGEAYGMFEPFIKTDGEKKPECYGEACGVCFQNQYCHDFMKQPHLNPLLTGEGIKR